WRNIGSPSSSANALARRPNLAPEPAASSRAMVPPIEGGAYRFEPGSGFLAVRLIPVGVAGHSGEDQPARGCLQGIGHRHGHRVTKQMVGFLDHDHRPIVE